MRAVTAHRLNRATLARQLLLRRERIGAVDAVGRVVAVQAQEPASPYLALWNRIADFDPAELDAAYGAHAVVKATLLRITLHTVTAEDYPAFKLAMVSSHRASRLNDARFAESGMTVEELDALLPDLLAFAATEPRSNADVEAWIAERVGRPVPRAWWALRTYAPVVHAPTGGPWSLGPRPVYVAARGPAPDGDVAVSVQRVVRRYLEGFGPASAHDIAQFTILRMPIVREALEALADELEVLEGPDGTVLYDVPGSPVPAEGTPAPARLMAMWDSTLLAYADRSRLIPPAFRASVIRRNGDVLPTLLVDGYVAGVWRAVDGGIEATTFQALPAEAWAELGAEAEALGRFLAGREPSVYRRYWRWWDSLPAVDVRVLPG